MGKEEKQNERNSRRKRRDEILKSWRETCELNQDHPQAASLFRPDKLPRVYDPFAGSGTIPLEAQRLGLSVLATDLNPVAVLINKALIEIPSRFAGRPPVNPEARNKTHLIDAPRACAEGLADDVRYYAQWMRREAEKRIGVLYPTLQITNEMARERPDLKPLVGQELIVSAWLWARTVKSPNPAFRHVEVPLISTYLLSIKAPGAYLSPVVEGDQYRFAVKVGQPPKEARNGTKLARGANFACLLSGTPISGDYIKAEGQAGRMGARLMAIVAQAARGRVYVAPVEAHEAAARASTPEWRPDVPISGSTQYIGVRPYGISSFSQLFTERQLVSLSTYADLIHEAYERSREDALIAGMPSDERGIDTGGTGAVAYAEAIATYLAFVVDRMAFYGSSLCGWLTKDNAMGKSMPQQALAMSWDFAEGNPFGKSSADTMTCAKAVADCLLVLNPHADGRAEQQDARDGPPPEPLVISTDPPYFDNVPYADLSDFFYIWLRRSLKTLFPSLFSTIAVPKLAELAPIAITPVNPEPRCFSFLNGGIKGLFFCVSPPPSLSPFTIPLHLYALKQIIFWVGKDRGVSSWQWVGLGAR